MNTKQKLKLVVAVLSIGLLGVGKAQAANPEDGTITVSPIATLNLSLAPTTYAYGPLAVSISSVAAIPVVLSNTGYVDVTVDKNIQTQSNPAGWTAATIASPTVGLNKYALYVATAAARPTDTDYADASHLFNGIAGTDLLGLGGGNPVVTTSGGALPSVDLWFMLKTPSAVSSQGQKEITVRFTATTN